MIKIWAKTYINKRISKHDVVFIDERYDYSRFDEYVRIVCHEMDIPTPIIVSSNETSFSKYNITKWKASDFIESVPFEEFSIENCPVD